MIQAKINHQEKIDEEEVEKQLDKEYKEYMDKLKIMAEDIRTAKEISNLRDLSIEESKELKRLYIETAKELHPDLNSNITEKEEVLWQRAKDAYERKLVKQIEVASITGEDDHNTPYIKLLSVDNKKSPITAKVEIDAMENGKLKRKSITVRQNDDLFRLSGGRDLYSGYIINDIYCEEGNEYIDFTSQEDIIPLGHNIGGIDEDIIKRAQIRMTIEEHLEKELRLNKEGVKVLSLFFIDKVDNYRIYKEDGSTENGKYARWFEEEYRKLLNKPKYQKLLNGEDIEEHIQNSHNGYFAKDNKGRIKDSKTGNSKDDEDTYNLIMKDKEKLLSFANIKVEKYGEIKYIGEEKSKKIFENLLENKYIENDGKVTRKLQVAIKENLFEVDKEFKEIEEDIKILLKKMVSGIKIQDRNDKRIVKPIKEVILSPKFQELWDNIKYKTNYSVSVDSEKLIRECATDINKNVKIDRAKILYEKGKSDISEAGVIMREGNRKLEIIDSNYERLPDILTILQNHTDLTRKTIAKILDKSGTLKDFKINPQKYIEEVANIINRKKRLLLVDGIKYTRIGNEAYSCQELFLDKELTGYLSKNIYEARKSTHEYVVYDSNVERTFAETFDANDAIKLYTKLPSEFKIKTPLGFYNPDWAVLVEEEGREKLYFVVETKGSTKSEDLRDVEQKKIHCGREHFKALNTDVEFEAYDDSNKFIDDIYVQLGK